MSFHVESAAAVAAPAWSDAVYTRLDLSVPADLGEYLRVGEIDTHDGESVLYSAIDELSGPVDSRNIAHIIMKNGRMQAVLLVKRVRALLVIDMFASRYGRYGLPEDRGGFGKLLMDKALEIEHRLGSRLALVLASSYNGLEWYQKYGFRRFNPSPGPFALAMAIKGSQVHCTELVAACALKRIEAREALILLKAAGCRHTITLADMSIFIRTLWYSYFCPEKLEYYVPVELINPPFDNNKHAQHVVSLDPFTVWDLE